MNGKVVSVNPAPDYPGWFALEIEGSAKPILVHRNWPAYYGDLNVGDEVKYELAKTPTYRYVEDHFFTDSFLRVNVSE